MEPIDPTKPTALTVVPWKDPADRSWADPRSAAADRWLPLTGIAGLWLMRRFASGLARFAEGFTLPVSDTAQALGLATTDGDAGRFHQTVDRLVACGLARWDAGGRLAVRRRLPPLPLAGSPFLADDLPWTEGDG